MEFFLLDHELEQRQLTRPIIFKKKHGIQTARRGNFPKQAARR